MQDEDRKRVLDRIIEEELLVQRGLALDLARQDRRVRADLTATVIDGVVSDANEREPTDEDIAAFYTANRDFFAGPGRVRVRQVFVRVTSPSDPAAEARAREAERRLLAGESFRRGRGRARRSAARRCAGRRCRRASCATISVRRRVRRAESTSAK
jgi:hypothetical protein